ncbi:hypothetical protein N7533_005489 [Penicillium manginii]|uniref:uncharacterized protein n=1 Tax=Penicillium manginii TaxID=203109 RepID=UPI00254930A8|nr:uncharacterized protein N7533_005489 [Penicillium manginii]KAJ5755946.1 hypothetical protein N7533_005489 [Penicillium manginii]
MGCFGFFSKTKKTAARSKSERRMRAWAREQDEKPHDPLEEEETVRRHTQGGVKQQGSTGTTTKSTPAYKAISPPTSSYKLHTNKGYSGSSAGGGGYYYGGDYGGSSYGGGSHSHGGGSYGDSGGGCSSSGGGGGDSGGGGGGDGGGGGGGGGGGD